MFIARHDRPENEAGARARLLAPAPQTPRPARAWLLECADQLRCGCRRWRSSSGRRKPSCRPDLADRRHRTTRRSMAGPIRRGAAVPPAPVDPNATVRETQAVQPARRSDRPEVSMARYQIVRAPGYFGPTAASSTPLCLPARVESSRWRTADRARCTGNRWTTPPQPQSRRNSRGSSSSAAATGWSAGAVVCRMAWAGPRRRPTADRRAETGTATTGERSGRHPHAKGSAMKTLAQRWYPKLPQPQQQQRPARARGRRRRGA